MKRFLRAVLVLAALGAGTAVAGYLLLVRHGFSAREMPSPAEEWLARGMRRMATPASVRNASNPVGATALSLARARAHFADHCALCHGNDGKGQTSLGRNMYPKAPDMTAAATQSLSDGEVFAIIENGIRLTGMPAFGSPDPADDAETWELVRFIRHLPKITAHEVAEMEALNPKSPKEYEEEEQIRRFLAGEEAKPKGGSASHDH